MATHSSAGQTGKQILMVIAPEKFRDEEYDHPRHVFDRAGLSVTVASTRAGTAKGMFDMRVEPDITISQALDREWDAVAVVGGMGSPEFLWGDADLRKIVQNAAKRGKVVAAICLSGVVLARAGLIDGKKATVWKSEDSLAEYKKAGVQYCSDPVVVTGRIVTGNGPEAARDFAARIVELLGK